MTEGTYCIAMRMVRGERRKRSENRKKGAKKHERDEDEQNGGLRA